MKIEDFISKLNLLRKEWDELLSQLEPEQLEIPGVIGDMSVKDLIAHVSWYEEQMVELLSTRVLAGSELWGLSPAERNQKIFELNKDRVLGEVLAESQGIHAMLRAELEKLIDMELVDAAAYEGMPEDWMPWKVIAGNSFEHYQQHFDDLKKWLESLSQNHR